MNQNNNQESIDNGIRYGLDKLGYQNDFKLKDKQKEAVQSFVQGNDVIVLLPTGYGKSLCFYLLPFISDFLKYKENSLVIIVSPLRWLISDQMSYLREREIPTLNLVDHVDGTSFENLKFIFATPEALLGSKKKILVDIYIRKNLLAFIVDEAHCVLNWGDSFRMEYKLLKKAFRKVPQVQKMALTATASTSSRDKIKDLLIFSPSSSSNVSLLEQRDNIKIHFKPTSEVSLMLNKLLDELLTDPDSIPKTVIFCSKIKDSTFVYHFFKYYTRNKPFLRNFFQLYTSCTEETIKKQIAEDFVQSFSVIKILVATSAFGMGVDAKEITRIFHILPPLTLDDYIQQIGRGGRGDEQVDAFLYFHLKQEDSSKELKTKNVISPEMKKFLNHSTCKREYIASYYGFPLKVVERSRCCDYCSDQN